MQRSSAVIIAVAVLLGVVVGLGTYTFVYAKGYSYLTNKSRRLRQLSCHAGTIRSVAEVEPSLGGHLQRLPHAA